MFVILRFGANMDKPPGLVPLH